MPPRAIRRCSLAGQYLTDQQLRDKLVIVLQSWPLYRMLEYTGADGVIVVPQSLTLYCPNCRLDSFWETTIYSSENHKEGFNEKEFRCKNCDYGPVRYYFLWYLNNKTKGSNFCKVGQYPALEERVSEPLEKALAGDDLKMYKNALRMRNFNLGIAAVAYLRRVVENRMNDMLDILHEAAVVHNLPKEVLDRVGEAKTEKRFSVKVDYAGDLLPANLRIQGNPNPMAILHELASAGIHEQSDEECVDVFDACRATFEYVFSKMKIDIDEARSYAMSMAELLRKKAQREKV